MNGLEDIPRVGRTLARRASQFERRTMWGQPPSAVRPLTVQHSCPPLKKTSMEDGRPRPSRFERWRASKFLSRHPEPRGDSRPRLSGGAQLRNSFMHCHPARASLRSEGSRRAVRKPRAFCEARSDTFGAHSIWKKNHVRAALSCPPKSPKPLQKHGKSGVTTPTTNLLKMVFCSCAYVPLAGIRM